MQRLGHRSAVRALAGLVVLIQLLVAAGPAGAASHREAPLIALDPAADITDVYFFRSWEAPTVVLVMNVIPGQEPSSGPNYFNFDDQVRYAFNLDTNRNGNAEDVAYEVRFKTKIQGTVEGARAPGGVRGACRPSRPWSGPNAAGIGIRQTYTRHRDPERPPARAGHAGDGRGALERRAADHAELRGPGRPGHLPPGNGGRVFAGQRDETFYIDLGATFDTVNLRRTPPILDAGEDANDAANPFGVDTFSGFNVSTIAIEIPISSSPATRTPCSASTPRRAGRRTSTGATTARRSARAARSRWPAWPTRSSTS